MNYFVDELDDQESNCAAAFNGDMMLAKAIRYGVLGEADQLPYETSVEELAVHGRDRKLREICMTLVNAGESLETLRKRDAEHLPGCLSCQQARERWEERSYVVESPTRDRIIQDIAGLR